MEYTVFKILALPERLKVHQPNCKEYVLTPCANALNTIGNQRQETIYCVGFINAFGNSVEISLALIFAQEILDNMVFIKLPNVACDMA